MAASKKERKTVWSVDDCFSGLDDAPCRDALAMQLTFGRREFWAIIPRTLVFPVSGGS